MLTGLRGQGLDKDIISADGYHQILADKWFPPLDLSFALLTQISPKRYINTNNGEGMWHDMAKSGFPFQSFLYPPNTGYAYISRMANFDNQAGNHIKALAETASFHESGAVDGPIPDRQLKTQDMTLDPLFEATATVAAELFDPPHSALRGFIATKAGRSRNACLVANMDDDIDARRRSA